MVFASDVEVHGRILVILRSKGGTLSVGGCLRVPRWECAISQPQTQASRKETAINPLWENKRLIDFVIIIKRIGHIPPCAWWYATWWHQSSSQSRFMLDQKHYITSPATDAFIYNLIICHLMHLIYEGLFWYHIWASVLLKGCIILNAPNVQPENGSPNSRSQRWVGAYSLFKIPALPEAATDI